MTSTLPLLDLVQQTASPSAPGAPVPFSVFQLGKALFTLSFFSLVTVAVMVRAVRSAKRGAPHAIRDIDLGLFWGVFTFGVGLFHVFMSLTSTFWSVQLYGPIEPGQQWLVARAAMLATLAGGWGTLVFLLAALVWIWLRRRHRLSSAEPATA